MILIYTPDISPRFEYISKLVFRDILCVEIEIMNCRELFRGAQFPKLNYSGEKIDDEPFIKACDFLFTDAKKVTEVKPVAYEGETGFFETSRDSILPFDPFASSFLLVSRMEEYMPEKTDVHGRFEAASSIQYKFGLLEKPMVNIWANMLEKKLKQIFPELKISKPGFRFLPTIDVDNAWAFRNKGFLRVVSSTVKDLFKLDIKRIRERWSTLIGLNPDPYDTYSYIDSVYKENIWEVIFFFHLGNYNRYDKSVSWKNEEFRKLIKTISGRYNVGIHPSYLSSETLDYKIVEGEKRRLETICGQKITNSRQHYLRLKFPETYNTLIKAGLMYDFSMGFHDMVGFRAGICTPFHFFDLINEMETPLVIFPFQIMDVTLKQYMKLSPDEAIDKIRLLMNQVREAGGIFCGIWHNESVSANGIWKDYRQVFEFMNREGFKG